MFCILPPEILRRGLNNVVRLRNSLFEKLVLLNCMTANCRLPDVLLKYTLSTFTPPGGEPALEAELLITFDAV
jgi:hypothetical protein